MKKISYFLLLISLTGCQADASDLSVRTFHKQSYIVFQPASLQQLKLGLNDHNKKSLGSFTAWQKQLGKCQSLRFAMNAGMYHSDYQPVGLYVENGQPVKDLNTENGSGNFFMKPNGVLAWNHKKAVVMTTEKWQKSSFDAQYASQSGPMLVVDGKIMDKFIAESDSRKIRNGVGIKDGQLYFVISEQAVNFYQFAAFFQQGLNVEQALYLDGSISSIYAPQLQRYDRAFKLGPMLGYVQHQPEC